MPSDKNQTERPDHWLTETTTPGLLVQVDVNSGETAAVLAGASALTRTGALSNLASTFQQSLNRIADEFNEGNQGDERPGLLLELAAIGGRNCADFGELLRPITEARTTSSAAEAHAYFFSADQGDQQEQAKRLRLLSRELELTAAHIRRVLE